MTHVLYTAIISNDESINENRYFYFFIYYDLLHTIQIHKGNYDNKTNKKAVEKETTKSAKAPYYVNECQSVFA